MPHFAHRSAAVAIGVALLMASVGIVSADGLQNELDVGAPDLVLDSLNVALGGGPVAVDVWLDAQVDSDVNCNLDGGDTAVFTVSTSNAAIATFSPASFTLTGCGSANAQAITVTPVAQGSANAQFTFDAGSSSVDAGETFTANTGNFTVVVDDPPSVSTTVPADNATGVAANSDIIVNFNEAVDITNLNGWYDISCTVSGSHTATTSGDLTNQVTLNPDTDFTAGETCTVTIVKNHVKDVDTVDGFDNMLANHVFDFSVSAAAVTPTLTTEVRDASTDTPATSFPFNTTVYDHAAVDSGAEGTVDFTLYSGSDCTDQLGSLEGSDTGVALVSGTADSTDFGPLSNDSYYFIVDYNSSDTDQWLDTSTCEEFTIEAPADDLSALSPFHGWIGLKNSDDQGTQFDLKAELFDGTTLVATGLQRCITGVTRNPSFAKEAIVNWGSFTPYDLSSVTTLTFKVSTRIGTTPTGTKCSGPGGSHNNAVGLRLYYDSTARQSRFDATIGSGSSTDWYLRSDGNACVNAESTGVTTRYLSMTAPTETSAKCKDSAGINFAGGNLWKEIGSWSWTLP